MVRNCEERVKDWRGRAKDRKKMDTSIQKHGTQDLLSSALFLWLLVRKVKLKFSPVGICWVYQKVYKAKLTYLNKID